MLLDVESELDPELNDDMVGVKLLVRLLVIEGRLSELDNFSEDDIAELDVKAEDWADVDGMLDIEVVAVVRILVLGVVAKVRVLESDILET